MCESKMGKQIHVFDTSVPVKGRFMQYVLINPDVCLLCIQLNIIYGGPLVSYTIYINCNRHENTVLF